MFDRLLKIMKDAMPDVDVSGADICRLVIGDGAYHMWRCFVIPSTVGLPHLGTACQSEQDCCEQDERVSHTFISSSSSMILRLLERRGTLC